MAAIFRVPRGREPRKLMRRPVKKMRINFDMQETCTESITSLIIRSGFLYLIFQEVYNVFYRVGARMGLKELPLTYTEWLPVREAHLMADLQKSKYTADLFKQYKKHLGAMRFKVLIEGQKLVVPNRVKELLQFSDFSLLTPVVPVYKVSRLMKMDWLLKKILLPSDYKDQINELDVHPGY